VPATKKIEEVKELEDLLSQSSGAIGLSYTGLTVAQADDLRHVIRSTGGKYRVVKNNLASIAAERADKHIFKELLQGQTGLVLFSEDNFIEPVKAITTHINDTKLELPIIGAVWQGAFLSNKEVQRIASLPSRERLQGQVLGLLQAPAQNLVSVLSSHMRNLVTILQERVKQLEQTQEGDNNGE
jgi:large subunit ribosomal protein L10